MEDEFAYTGDPDSGYEAFGLQKRGYYFVPPFAAFIFSGVFAGLPLLWNDKWLFFFQLLAFFALGFVSARLLRTSLHSFLHIKGLATIAATLCVIGIVFYSFSYVGVYFRWFSIAAIGSAFLLPFNIKEFLKLYVEINVKTAKIWQQPVNWPALQPKIFLNGMVVQFDILFNANQDEPLTVMYNASKLMKLGDAFLEMIQKQKNNGVREFSIINPGETSYAWIFFTTNKFGLHQNLDPAATLPENGINKSTIIYACRFSMPARHANEASPISNGLL